MKFKMTLNVELDDDIVKEIGEHNLKYILTDALHDFQAARTFSGTRAVSEYVVERYPNMSAGEQILKANQVRARLNAACDFFIAVHHAKIERVADTNKCANGCTFDCDCGTTQ